MSKSTRTKKPGEVKIRRCKLCGAKLTSNWWYCNACKKKMMIKNTYSDPVSDYKIHYPGID
jgi:lipopolysaccharide biosynthesis regulator YciM